MSLGGRSKSIVKRAGRWAGYDIVKAGGASTMEAALERVARSHRVQTVIDVGASDGRWSEMAIRHFPDAAFLLVEAQASPHELGLHKLPERYPKMQYVIAAAGDHVGTIHFDASDPFGGAAAETPFAEGDLVVAMTTIDAEVARLKLSPRFLLKLDTHGFERQILDGAADTLAQAEVLVIEAYNFTLQPGALRFHQLCNYLDERGFRTVDLVDTVRRPGDGVLWQFDLFFTRSDHVEFASNSYQR